VGSKGRVCLRLASECNVEKHRRDKVTKLPALREVQGVDLVASKNSVYVRPSVDTSLLTEERLANWRTSQMLLADWVATFSLHEGDLETQPPPESLVAEEISEFTSQLQASSRMLATPKRARFADPEEKGPFKSKFRKLPIPSPGNLGAGRDLMLALRDHQSQFKSVRVALQVAQGENQQEAAQLSCLQTAVADKATR
jgi:hypothetical protein